MYFGSFRTFRPRHPLARIAVAVLGFIAVLALVALGLFAIAALAIGGGIVLLVNALRGVSRGATPPAASAARPAPTGVIEGEYTVVPTPSTREPTR